MTIAAAATGCNVALHGQLVEEEIQAMYFEFEIVAHLDAGKTGLSHSNFSTYLSAILNNVRYDGL